LIVLIVGSWVLWVFSFVHIGYIFLIPSYCLNNMALSTSSFVGGLDSSIRALGVQPYGWGWPWIRAGTDKQADYPVWTAESFFLALWLERDGFYQKGAHISLWCTFQNLA
jgi:hypothetical protein